jgi:hypothetical protein
MLPEFLTKNLKLKFVSLLLAVLLQLYLISPRNFDQATLRVPVEILNVPPSVMLVDPSPTEVFCNIKVRGPKPIIEQIQSNNFRLIYNYPRENKTSFTVIPNPDDLRLPPGAQVLEVEPSKFDLRYEKIVKKEVGVNPKGLFVAAKGFKIAKITAEPAVVTLRGPEGEVRGISKLETDYREIRDLKQSEAIEVPLKDISTSNNNLLTTLSVNIITLRIDVESVDQPQVKP